MIASDIHGSAFWCGKLLEAASTEKPDKLILLDIYPARELPIEGVSSQLIYDHLRTDMEKILCQKEEVLDILTNKNIEVLITLGAGDIENYAPQICEILNKKC